jgi:quinol monooxygenase YgiN
MITVNMMIRVSSQKCSKALQLINIINGTIQSVKGLISCKAYQDIDDEDTLVMIQKWESGEVMERYIKSANYRAVMDLLELSCEQPEVSFDTVSGTRGMKYLNAVRGNSSEANL